MRRATVLAVGSLKGWAREGSEDYLRRLRRYFPVEVAEVAEEDLNRRTPEEVLMAESERLRRRLPEGAYVMALDRERGRPTSSTAFAERLERLGLEGRSHVAFVIGGALGLDEALLRRADARVSFGPITLPHALARIVLLEQLFRAVKISRGEKYHW
ncbi:23S rRNA (pseudouridine(1915)-N(3))-methyltransferase RlmH [Rubrobacter taiwanensis]|uniref:Ribosomal RNA large subunit methyltransferase H n=1 Tax=Rubrobacter taiwanensis TaxID=185139 RepID=A0A4R1BPA4_9ACTN|nr:23S rRNA (pseudouridine(1915)-N(3))-methyltransferase RlmH [Rubrobacter taiwanensis]